MLLRRAGLTASAGLSCLNITLTVTSVKNNMGGSLYSRGSYWLQFAWMSR